MAIALAFMSVHINASADESAGNSSVVYSENQGTLTEEADNVENGNLPDDETISGSETIPNDESILDDENILDDESILDDEIILDDENILDEESIPDEESTRDEEFVSSESTYTEDTIIEGVSAQDLAARFDVPYIATYYFNPKPTIYDSIQIPLYFTDYEHSEYLNNDTSVTLDLLYEVDGVANEIKNLSLGDYTLNLGTLSAGNHVFSVQVRDNRNGLTSHKLYNDLWVVNPATYDITSAQTYFMTDADLAKYKINKNNSTNPTDMVNTRNGLNQLFEDVKSQGYRKIVLLNGTYRIDGADPTGKRQNSIIIPSNFTVDMNQSTFKLNPILADIAFVTTQNPNTTTPAIGCLVLMDNCVDSHLINGTLDGDRFERQDAGLETVNANRSGMGEQINTVLIKGGKYCSVSNLTIKNTTGHSVVKFYEWGKEIFLAGFTRTAIFNKDEIAAPNCSTSAMTDLKPIIDHCKSESEQKYMGEYYMYVGHPQGYRGIHGDSAIVYVSFYDESKTWISTVTGYQYRKILMPENARYARVTLLGDKIKEVDYSSNDPFGGTVSIYSKHYGDYCEFSNLDFYDTRTCAIAPATCSNLLIENCTYTRSGNSITPAAVDFEDGAQECQDVYYMNNAVLESSGTATLIDNYGFNHVFINNSCHSYEVRNRVVGGLITGITDKKSQIVWKLGDQVHAAYGRIFDNDCYSIVVTDIQGYSNGQPIYEANPVNFDIKNCTMAGSAMSSAPRYVEYENCVFTNFSGGYTKLVNCTVQFAKGVGSQVGAEIYAYDCTFMPLDGTNENQINWNQAQNANRVFENCRFLGKSVPNNFLASGTFTNCEFEDISITAWVNERTTEKVLFENCTFYSTGNFFLNAGPMAYSEGYMNYTFKNCSITHLGNNLVQTTATVYNGSQIVFDHCSINKAVNTSLNPSVIKVINDIPKMSSTDAKLSGCSLTITDQIMLNFHITMSSSLRSNTSAIVHIVLPNGKYADYKLSEGILDTKNANTYIYPCEVPAAYMNTAISAKIIIPSDTAVPSKESEAFNCSVKTYADAMLKNSGSYTANEIDLLKAMLNYGGYAQKYFGINPYNLVNNNLYTQANNPVNTAPSGITVKNPNTIASNNNLKFIGSSVVCESATSLRLYFKIGATANPEELKNRLKVKAVYNNKQYNCVGEVIDGVYVITLQNIKAADLDFNYSFTITDTASSANTLTFTYSPMNYIAAAQQSGNTNLVNLTRALYYYNQAAKKMAK